MNYQTKFGKIKKLCNCLSYITFYRLSYRFLSYPYLALLNKGDGSAMLKQDWHCSRLAPYFTS